MALVAALRAKITLTPLFSQARTKLMPIDYNIPGKDPRFVHKFDGAAGPFFVAQDGADKEAVYRFIYGDEVLRLTFFAEYEINIARTDGLPAETVTVHKLTFDLRQWDTFVSHQGIIRENIDLFFRDRWFQMPGSKRAPGEPITILFL